MGEVLSIIQDSVVLETGPGLKAIHISFQEHSAAYSWPFPDVPREKRNTYSLW